ncbi:hypothetical protein CPB86DRAFT_789015, partial [Serendipita vermifera]
MEYLWPLLARGALPICATNQRGVDIMIPVVLGDMVNETTVTAIFIQVKNENPSKRASVDYFSNMDPVLIKLFPASEELEIFKHPFIRIVMAFQGEEDSVKQHHVEPDLRMDDYTSYDILCRGITHKTYPVIKDRDEVDWRRCLDILGGYAECLKYPDGTEMSSYAEEETRSRYPCAYPTEEFPYIWLGKGQEDK